MALRGKAFHRGRSSAWESIRGGMVNRRETEEIRVSTNVRRAACPNRGCIATRSRAANPSGRACYRRRPPSRLANATSAIWKGHMTYWQRWISHPQTAWLRKATFQLHLWSGIGIGLYVLVISVTGSIVVYRNE